MASPAPGSPFESQHKTSAEGKDGVVLESRRDKKEANVSREEIKKRQEERSFNEAVSFEGRELASIVESVVRIESVLPKDTEPIASRSEAREAQGFESVEMLRGEIEKSANGVYDLFRAARDTEEELRSIDVREIENLRLAGYSFERLGKLIETIGRELAAAKTKIGTLRELEERQRAEHLQRSGFSSLGQIVGKKEDISTEYQELWDSFLGRWRYAKRLRELREEASRLSDLHSDAGMDSAGYLRKDTERLEQELCGVARSAISRAANIWEARQRKFINELHGAERHKIPPEALQDVEKLFFEEADRRIRGSLEESGGDQDEKVSEAKTILREAIGDPGLAGDVYRLSEDRLPGLGPIIDYMAKQAPKLTDIELMGKFADFAMRLEKLSKKKEAYESLRRNLASVLPPNALKEFWVYNAGPDEDRSFNKLASTPIETLNGFFGSEAVNEAYEGKLPAVRKHLSDFFGNMLVNATPRGEEAIELGRKLARFKSPETAPLFIFNAFREPGHSGEMPFVSIHTNPSNTEVFKYISGLTPEEIEALAKQDIPGLMDVIKIVKENPETFSRSSLYDPATDKYSENSPNQKLGEALGKMGIYFLLRGPREFGMYGIERIGPAINQDGQKEIEKYFIETKSEEALQFFVDKLFRENNGVPLSIVSGFLNSQDIPVMVKRMVLSEMNSRSVHFTSWRRTSYLQEKYDASLSGVETLLRSRLESEDAGERLYALENLLSLRYDLYESQDLSRNMTDIALLDSKLSDRRYDGETSDGAVREALHKMLKKRAYVLTEKDAQLIASSDYNDNDLFVTLLLRGIIEEDGALKRKLREGKGEGNAEIGEDLTRNLELNEKTWPAFLSQYVRNMNLNWNESSLQSHPEIRRVRKIFDEDGGRDFCWNEIKKEWREALRSEDSDMPTRLLAVAAYLPRATHLKYFRALGGMILATGKSFSAKTTAGRTKGEIKSGLLSQEERFAKGKWTEDEKANFYSVSERIVSVAPSLYTNFLEVFAALSPKDMEAFVKYEMPLYEAALFVMRSQDANKPYDPRDLVVLRRSLRELQEDLAGSEENRIAVFKNRRTEVLDILKDSLGKKIGLRKIPSEIDESHIRSIQDGLRYMSNLEEKNFEKETLLAFFMGLGLNGKWEAFRRGEDVDPAEYFDGERLESVRHYLAERKNNENITPELVGISPEDWPEFQKLLQEEVILKRMGNIETIDMKVGSVYRNLRDLEDEDAYEDLKDKALIVFLKGREALAGTALAKTYGRLAGKAVELKEGEQKCIDELGRILNIKEWTLEAVKSAQNKVKLPSLILKTVRRAEEAGVQEAISELQKRLQPSEAVIAIFNKMGEEFKVASGALALSQDISYLERLKIKNESKLSEDEKEIIDSYLNPILESLQRLERVYENLKEYFFSMKQSLHLSSGKALQERMGEIEKAITRSEESVEVTSRITNNLNLVIENIRQCLGCLEGGCNNDTNLTFGDSNKFFLMSQTNDELEGRAMEQVSIADELAFFVPSVDENGGRRATFVLDQVYGTKSSEIVVSHAAVIAKKIRAIRKRFSDIRLSILVTDSALASGGVDSETLRVKLGEEVKSLMRHGALEINVPPSAAGKHYIEFGMGGRSDGGTGKFSGLIIEG